MKNCLVHMCLNGISIIQEAVRKMMNVLGTQGADAVFAAALAVKLHFVRRLSGRRMKTTRTLTDMHLAYGTIDCNGRGTQWLSSQHSPGGELHLQCVGTVT
ncbi:hypothetical protein TNCV_4393651 [Trichonephila clavipes]|nr:hypothetical protein TNCV_4393651 [Trichonephila clavipes]